MNGKAEVHTRQRAQRLRNEGKKIIRNKRI